MTKFMTDASGNIMLPEETTDAVNHDVFNTLVDCCVPQPAKAEMPAMEPVAVS